LYVSRRLVNFMQGFVGIDVRPNQGYSYWIQIPLPKQKETSSAADATSVELNGLRVLVADPSATLRQSMGEILKAWGARVDEAPSPEAALLRMREAALAGDPVRVAVIDIQMPTMTGEQLGETIRKDPQLADIRTMLLTSVGRKGDAALASAAGFSAYLIKPVPWSELYDAVAEVMRRDPAPLGQSVGRLVTRHSLAEARRSRFRILLVEDDPVNRLVTEWALRRHGYSFTSVQTAGQALETCGKQRFDLVLMDLQMPDMDGYKAAGALRARERGGTRTPIVAMTGNALPGERERCLQAGMDDYLSKPIDLRILCEIVERWTHGKNEAAGVRAATAGPSGDAGSGEDARLTETARGSGGSSPRIQIVGRAEYSRVANGESAKPEAKLGTNVPIDFQRLDDTSMGIAALREALIGAFLNDVSPRVERLAEATQVRDARRVEFEAHGLKGMAATIGAIHCVTIFNELERCGREMDVTGAVQYIESARTEVARVRAYLEGLDRQDIAA
jgi:CheY-like chemotaxis protein/HPt (histidine-containing phosphotransfer) domain-containing protein